MRSFPLLIANEVAAVIGALGDPVDSVQLAAVTALCKAPVRRTHIALNLRWHPVWSSPQHSRADAEAA